MNKRIHKLIDEAALPEACADCVRRVVKRTRLWTRERCDVASELIAHFQDGLEAGASPEELAQSFGNEKAAAKLIRRAKKRCRPLAWHITRGVGWTCTAIVSIYIFAAALLVLGNPAINTNYLAKLNAHAATVPENERAWPRYRDALLMLGMDMRMLGDLRRYGSAPGTERWPEMVRLLKEQQSTIEQLRLAARQPGLGYHAGFDHAPQEVIPSGRPYDASREHTYKDRELAAVLLPHLGWLRAVGGLLAADARFAAELRDGRRIEQDILALYGVADHAVEVPLLINASVAIVIERDAHELLGIVLKQYPETMTDDQLQRLAHQLAVRREQPLLQYEGERYGFLDFCQRIYTNNGRLTNEGLRLLASYDVQLDAGTRQPAVTLLTWPAAVFLIAPRAEIESKYDHFMAKMKQDAAEPMHMQPYSEATRQIRDWSAVQRVRYAPLTIFVPVYDAMRAAEERRRAYLDSVMIAIALTLYQREHRQWPASLGALVPRYLPTVPIDRITGEPLRYRVTDDGPIVYSVGVDRDDDDGGQSGDMSRERGVVQWLTDEQYEQRKANGDLPDGDWVLWPPPSQ